MAEKHKKRIVFFSTRMNYYYYYCYSYVYGERKKTYVIRIMERIKGNGPWKYRVIARATRVYTHKGTKVSGPSYEYLYTLVVTLIQKITYAHCTGTDFFSLFFFFFWLYCAPTKAVLTLQSRPLCRRVAIGRVPRTPWFFFGGHPRGYIYTYNLREYFSHGSSTGTSNKP